MSIIIDAASGSFRMSVVFDKTTQTYMLIFSSVKDNKGQQYTCSSYMDAVNRFNKNCRFYGVPEVSAPTEADFLGIPDSVFPRSNQQPLAKEVVYAKNRT